MGSRKKKPKRPTLQRNGLVAMREEIEQAFRDMVKAIPCPACGLDYTDFAVEWGNAWSEGRQELFLELGHLEGERDSPFKLKCELCGQKAWLNYFTRTVTRVGEPVDPANRPRD